ncbi:MAG: hypothetical protein RLZZ143_2690, partial [Cyanobacteriota bacterium]
MKERTEGGGVAKIGKIHFKRRIRNDVVELYVAFVRDDRPVPRLVWVVADEIKC